MSGLAGFAELKPEKAYQLQEAEELAEKREERRKQIRLRKEILQQMGRRLAHRGRAEQGIYQSAGCGLVQVSEAVREEEARQPMVRISHGEEDVLALDGVLFNARELRLELECRGCHLVGDSDAELLLAGLMEFGPGYIKKVNGVFAFAWWQRRTGRLWLCRDRLGVKPLFYMQAGGQLIFASELKGLEGHPEGMLKINHCALQQVLGIGPARMTESGVYEGVKAVLPGSWLTADEGGIRKEAYWQLESRNHTDNYVQTVLRVRDLLEDAILRQMRRTDTGEKTRAAFLSGGLDSSIVTAVAAGNLRKKGEVLDTYAFEFEGSREYFRSNAFQPSLDSPFADLVVRELGTKHQILTCMNEDLIENLYKAMEARDLPGMADVDASLLYFCEKAGENTALVLTGEGADEIFGGYPWFRRKEALSYQLFPWSGNPETRRMLLRDEAVKKLNLEEVARQACRDSLVEMPVLEGESREQERHRQLTWLTLKWFGAALIDRMDRMAMASGLDARMPFLDYRLVEYLWNVPWDLKAYGGETKQLLRDAAKGWIPEAVRIRKKSPYPKTYHPEYQQKLGAMLCRRLEDKNAKIGELVDREKVIRFLKSPVNVNHPWYGQLMAGPQLLAYLLQVDFWLERHVGNL